MAKLLTILRDELVETAGNPKRLLNLFDPRRLRTHLDHVKLKKQISLDWKNVNGDGRFRSREYDSYEQYVEHQREKLETIRRRFSHEILPEYDVTFREALRDRLSKLDIDWSHSNALCLAARIGTEVKAFLDVGAFAIGIDLNPGEENKYVVTGDFHNLQYADHSIDVIYSNSLDHAFDMEKILTEARRVLRPTGHLIVEPVQGREEGPDPQYYEAFSWPKIDDFADLIESNSFKLVNRTTFTVPWNGEQLVFKVANVAE